MKLWLTLTATMLIVVSIVIVVAAIVAGTAALIGLGLVSLSPAFPFGLAMIFALGILGVLFGLVAAIVIAADNF